jgi:hypothetical protein
VAVVGQPLGEQHGVRGGRAGRMQPALPQAADVRGGQQPVAVQLVADRGREQRLSKEAGSNIYERAQLAKQLMDDQQWVATEHGNDDWKALEDQFFADIAIPLTDLIALARRYPKEETWAANGYKLRDRVALMRGGRRKHPRRTATLAQLAEAESKAKHFEAACRTLKREAEELRESAAKLSRENGHLKGRVQELEAVLDRHFCKRPA